jgi:hypothetical protein
MKKVFLFIAALMVAQLSSFALGVQAGIKPGAVASQTVVTLKNNSGAAIVGNYLSSFTVTVRIPNQGANNPTVTVTGLSGTTPSVSPAGLVPIIQGTYAYYNIACTYSGNQPFPMTVAQEKDIVAFSFYGNGGSVTIIPSVELVDFPAGGPGGQAQLYLAIAGNTMNDLVSPFYATPQSSGLDNAGDPRKVGIGAVPLPVSWLDFTAVQAGETSLLNWATATETGNIGFDVERSADGKSFSKIGFVNTLANEGNSTAKLAYTFTDNEPLNGVNQYRLKQVNIDGKANYSKTTRVTFGGGTTRIAIYPNPVNGGTVSVKGNNISSIAVYNIAGQQIQVPVTYGVSENVLSTSGLASGNYTIRVSADGAVTNHKLVVQH